MDDKAFRDYYEFDDDDLYANRMGRLSDKQYQALARTAQNARQFSKAGGLVALAVSAIVPCIFLPLSLLTVYTKDWTTTLIAWASSLLWLAVFGGAGAWLLRSARRAGPTNLPVTRVEGQAELTQVRRSSGGEHSRTYIVHFLKVGDLEFELDDELVGHVAEGENIAVYSAGDQIMSVELVAGHAL